jgi:hypothetical protein
MPSPALSLPKTIARLEALRDQAIRAEFAAARVTIESALHHLRRMPWRGDLHSSTDVVDTEATPT